MGATPNFRILPQWTQTRRIQTLKQAFVEEMQDDDEMQFLALAARAQEEKETITSAAAAATVDTVRVGDNMELPTPNQILTAQDVVTVCMDFLANNNEPRENAGLEVNFNFSSDRCRASLGGELDKFISYASNPTFGSLIYSREWAIKNVGPMIEGTNTRGAMQTVLVKVVPRSGRDRHFLWTLMKERRPPRQGCWLIHEVIFVENAFSLTL